MSIDMPAAHPPGLDREPRVRRRPRDHAPEPLLGPPHDVNYPDSDGRPMSDNTLQFEWISLIKGGLDALFRDDPHVFVAGNLMWYPVEGRNRRRLAPDAMVAFGRPKGYRGSYVQHREEGVPPQVVFEIWSPGNRRRVIDYKFRFYQEHGVEEYYHFEPFKAELDGWVRDGEILRPIAETSGWVSPRLGIRFELDEDLTIFGPDGRPFESFAETARQRDHFEQSARMEARRADREAYRADREAEARHAASERADREAEARRAASERADREAEARRAASERADREAEARHAASERADRLAARLREMGLDPEG